MGCRLSSIPPALQRHESSQHSAPEEPELLGDPNEHERTRDIGVRRATFVRSASSSTSSLTNTAFNNNSRRKPRKHHRKSWVGISSSKQSTSIQYSQSILGEEKLVLDLTQVLETVIKEDNEVHRPPPINSPGPVFVSTPHPHSNNKSSVSRFLARKTGLLNDDQQNPPLPMVSEYSVSSSHEDSQPISKNVSSENFLLRIPVGSGLGLRKSALLAEPVSTPRDAPVPSLHRRQGSESSMFSRIVRVSSLTPQENESLPNSSTTKAFRNFLKKYNHEDLTDEFLETWKSNKIQADESSDRWTLAHIQEYLYSATNQAKNIALLSEPHDMTRPITEYFISTSHNTYLTGGQWVYYGGKVDLQMYARVLRQGCRCVEIDLYDGADQEPIVTHGTPAVAGGSCTFLEVCALVAKEAFRNSYSNLPLILNLENNLRTQSKRAAEILTGVFGSKLVRIDDPEYGWEGNPTRKSFPSIAQLAGRVLCRSKPKDASEEYQNLIYLRNSHWKFSASEDLARRKFYQTSSLSETKVKGAIKKLPIDISPLELNRVFLNRVYPRSNAYYSQNFSPLPLWLLGFQLVALNFQTEGLEMDLNRCMFERNGNSGVILKPSLMRRNRFHSRMNGGVRSSKNALLIQPSSRILLPESGSPSSANYQPNRSFLNSSRLMTKVESNKEKSKSFMGVVENAFAHQNEDEDEIDEEEDVPPSLPHGSDLETPKSASTVSEQLVVDLPKLSAIPKHNLEDRNNLSVSHSHSSSDVEKDKVLSFEEKNHRMRARRKSTGSILTKEPSSEVVYERKKSLEDLKIREDKDLKDERIDSIFEQQDEPQSALNSVLIQFISVKCNVAREKKVLTVKRADEHEEELPEEEVYIELSVDGHPLDRIEKRTVSSVIIRGTEPVFFIEKEELAAVLKDSETALFTIRIVDSLDPSQTVASRSFFAHCLLPGIRELVLLGDDCR